MDVILFFHWMGTEMLPMLCLYATVVVTHSAMEIRNHEILLVFKTMYTAFTGDSTNNVSISLFKVDKEVVLQQNQIDSQ